jgi:integrase
MLTNAVAKAAKARPRSYKLADAGGLHLFVAPTGTKSWRLKYRFGGVEKLLTIGRFPDVSLPEARARREAAKEQLRGGVDPSGTARVGAPAETFEQLARAWYAHKLDSWSSAHAADVIRSLERDFFPAMGKMAIGAIEPPQLLRALRVVEARGRIETARRLRQRLSKIFRYGIAEGLATKDLALELGEGMRTTPRSRPQPALTAIEDCRALLAGCEEMRARVPIRLASRFLALTAVRMAAVRGMRWDEVAGLDGDAPIWRVPPARMKMELAKKQAADAGDRFAHLVPLSPPAVAVLREAADQFGSGTSPIGESAIGDLYARTSFAGRHVPHGWRASFSTILNRELGREWRDDIDEALAHAAKGKVEAAYNRAELIERRREVFDRWGAMLAP